MKGSPCVFLINNEYLELKWQIYGSPITIFPSMKDREGIIAPVSLSCRPGSIYRKPAPPEPLQMAQSRQASGELGQYVTPTLNW